MVITGFSAQTVFTKLQQFPVRQNLVPCSIFQDRLNQNKFYTFLPEFISKIWYGRIPLSTSFHVLHYGWKYISLGTVWCFMIDRLMALKRFSIFIYVRNIWNTLRCNDSFPLKMFASLQKLIMCAQYGKRINVFSSAEICGRNEILGSESRRQKTLVYRFLLKRLTIR